MQDLDFGQVKGFEPYVGFPYHSLSEANVDANESAIFDLSAYPGYLDNLTTSLGLPAKIEPKVESNDEPETVPFNRWARQYTRVPVSGRWTAAELRILGRKYHCQIVEMSIGGFGVLVPQQLAIHPGTLGQFFSTGFNYIVSVTRIEPRGEASFIGLKQVEEISEDSPHHPNQAGSAAGYLLAGVAGALIAVLAYYFMQSH